jgi:hypothetical protein
MVAAVTVPLHECLRSCRVLLLTALLEATPVAFDTPGSDLLAGALEQMGVLFEVQEFVGYLPRHSHLVVGFL